MEYMAEPNKQLTPKDVLFVEEYLINLNPEQSALTAGYSASMAKTKAYQWVSDSKDNPKPEVYARIQKRIAERAKRAEITADKVLNEIAKIAFFDAKRLFNDDGSPKGIHELDDESSGAIAGVDVVTIGNDKNGFGQILKYKVADKNKALEQLCKHFGLNAPVKQEITGKDGAPLNPPELIIEISGKS